MSIFGRWSSSDNVEALEQIERETKVANRRELLEFCARVRNYAGGDPLTDLLPGITGKANSCLIAENLNFGCRVQPESTSYIVTKANLGYKKIDRKYVVYGKNTSFPDQFSVEPWVMIVEDGRVARDIANNLNLPTSISSGINGFEFAIHLPLEIGNAARAFDESLAFRDLTKGPLDRPLV